MESVIGLKSNTMDQKKGVYQFTRSLLIQYGFGIIFIPAVIGVCFFMFSYYQDVLVAITATEEIQEQTVSDNDILDTERHDSIQAFQAERVTNAQEMQKNAIQNPFD